MPIVDAIREAVPIPTGIERDDSGAEPIAYGPDRLYAWAGTEQRVEEGTGRIDRGDFTVMLALTVASDEADSGIPDRDTSLALDDGVDAIAAWVRDHRTDPTDLWEDLAVSGIEYSGLRGFEHRGHRMTLAGYRLIYS